MQFKFATSFSATKETLARTRASHSFGQTGHLPDQKFAEKQPKNNKQTNKKTNKQKQEKKKKKKKKRKKRKKERKRRKSDTRTFLCCC